MWGSAMQMTGSWLVCMTLESSVCLCGFSSKWLQQKCVPHRQPYLVFTSVWTSAWLFQSWFRPRKLSVKPKVATMTSSLPSKPRKAKQKKSNGNWIIPGLWCRTESEGLPASVWWRAGDSYMWYVWEALRIIAASGRAARRTFSRKGNGGTSFWPVIHTIYEVHRDVYQCAIRYRSALWDSGIKGFDWQWIHTCVIASDAIGS